MTFKKMYISSGHNFYGRHGKGALGYQIEDVSEIDCVAGSGIVGDRFFDYKPDYKGQISFFDWAVYQRVMAEVVGGEVSPEVFRRNVMVEGLDLNALIGKRFRLGEVEFTGSSECSPCYWMDEACAPGTHEFLKGQGGLRARIVKSGKLFVGEQELEILGDVLVDIEKKASPENQKV